MDCDDSSARGRATGGERFSSPPTKGATKLHTFHGIHRKHFAAGKKNDKTIFLLGNWDVDLEILGS